MNLMQGLITLTLKLGWWLRKVDSYAVTTIVSGAVLGERYTRQAFNPNASGLASLQWDSAELIQIGVQEQMNYDDAFTIEEVCNEITLKITNICGY